MNPAEAAQIDDRLQHRQRWHLVMAFVCLLVSFAFYSSILDNGFWHGEDFLVLETAQHLASDPSRLLRHDVIARHHPVTLALYVFEYQTFGLDPRGWYTTNLFLHALNAWLVYWLVTALVTDRRMAVLSGLLFAVGVGSYGKAVMFIAGAENLLITTLYLLILNLYVRNDLFGQRRLLSVRYALVLILFLLVSFAKPTTFALVGGLMAYQVFFSNGAGRRPWTDARLWILVLAAIGFWAVREATGVVDFHVEMAGGNPFSFAVNFVKNMIQYIIHMFFPIHVSHLVETSHPLVKTLYAMAPLIRFLIGLSIVSYSLFGFVFGNRTIRFFLAWTFISVLPYCAVRMPEDWLNIRYLYQVSIGFVFIVSAGTMLSTDLLHRRPRRRWLPLVVPMMFVVLSGYITARLDEKYESQAAAPESRAALEQIRATAGPGESP